VDDAEFADGFDRPDRLAFGLGAAQLLVVAAGFVIAYLLVRSGVVRQVALPCAVLVATLSAGLGWLRVGGRPALDWALLAARYATRPRDGSLLISTPALGVRASTARQAASAVRAPERTESSSGMIVPLFRDHRAPDVGAEPARVAAATTSVAATWPARRPMADCTARRVVFFSLRGGTGRTTLSVELACWLARHGRSARSDVGPNTPMQVALVDLDALSPSVAVRLGIPQPVSGSAHLHPGAPDVMVVHRSGVHVLIGGPAATAAGGAGVDADRVAHLLARLDDDGFDAVVIDVDAGITPGTRAALASADDVFIVMTPTASGVQDAYRTTEALRTSGIRDQLRYVVNRARADIDLSDTIADLAGLLVAEIPEDGALIDAENRHHVLALEGTGPAAHALSEFGSRVLRQIHAP